MSRPGRQALSLAAVVALAVAARLLAQIALGFYSDPERWEYDRLARNLLAGNGYQIAHLGTTYYGFAAPSYPVLLAVAYRLLGDPLGAGVLQLALGGALAATAYGIGLRLGGRLTAVLSAIAVATHPGLVVYAAKVHALSLDALLGPLLILLLMRLREAPSIGLGAGYGALVGVAVLERPTLVPFALMGMGVLLFVARPRATVVRGVFLAVVIAALGPSAWAIRNAVVIGTPTLRTTHGEILWRGNNPVASGGGWAADGRPVLDAAPEVRDLIWGRPETEQNAIFLRLATDYMVSDPARTVRNTLKKFGAFWWSGPAAGRRYPPRWTALYTGYYLVALALALLGAALLVKARRFWEVGMFGMTMLTVSLLQSLFYVEGRHRWGVESLLLILAAIPLAGLLRWVASTFRVSRQPRPCGDPP